MENNDNEVSKYAFKKGLLLGFLISAALSLIAILLMKFVFSDSYGEVSKDKLIDENTLKKVQNIQEIIASKFYHYSDDVGEDNLEDGIFRGMIESLGDPYSEYFNVEEMTEKMNGIEGISYGIGCYVSVNENGVAEIAGVVEGSPAEKAELKAGDLIIEVEGESVIGKSLSEIVKLIKGPEGTEVNITFSRDGEPFTKTIARGNAIETNTVVYGTLIDNEEIGYIQIKEFDDVTLNQYNSAYAELREGGIKSLILDLRGNPGGNLNTAVDIARQILPEGIVVYTEDKNGDRKDYTCDGKNEMDLPLVVLVDKYSASASEILSGAIQDYKKGTIVGETTYGKGIVQNIFSLGDGTAVKLTISSYFTPLGRNIHGTGIIPDVEVEYDSDLASKEGIDTQVNKAVEILTKEMGN